MNKNSPEPIAIVGLAFEFPQEETTEQDFWQMVVERRFASTDFPKDRLNIDVLGYPDDSRNSMVRASCPLDDLIILPIMRSSPCEVESW